MRDLGGKPHWAKNFSASAADVEAWFGDDLERWRDGRHAAPTRRMFVGPGTARVLLSGEQGPAARGDGSRGRRRATAACCGQGRQQVE